MAKCVPKCDSNAHFIQRALTNNQRRFRRNNTAGSRVVFGGKMCTRSKFKSDFFLHRAQKKPRVGFAAKNELRPPSVFFVAKCVLARNSNAHFLRRAPGKTEDGFDEKTRQVRGFFLGAKMRTRSKFKFHCSPAGAKKNQGRFRRQKKNSAPRLFFRWRNAH